MNYDDFLLEALDTASAWHISEDCFEQAVADRMLSDLTPDIYLGLPEISPYSTLCF